MTGSTVESLIGAAFGLLLTISGIGTLYIGVSFLRIALYRYMGWQL
jgi:hypothetical protein